MTYTNVKLGLLGRIAESYSILSSYRNNTKKRVANAISEADEFTARLEKSNLFENQKPIILEIGCGQFPVHLARLSSSCQVIGIDNEWTDGLNWMRILKKNGPVRAFKTAVRGLAGIDKSLKAEAARQLGLGFWPSLDIRSENASKMSFSNGSFDGVYSRAVFEHLDSPGEVMKEVARILKPGGLFFCMLHLYTSDSGCHDTRIFSGRRSGIPYWAHLDPQTKHLVHQNTYLNELRLSAWEKLSQENLPGSKVEAMCDDLCPERLQFLKESRKKEKFNEYTDAELLSPTVVIEWKKPFE